MNVKYFVKILSRIVSIVIRVKFVTFYMFILKLVAILLNKKLQLFISKSLMVAYSCVSCDDHKLQWWSTLNQDIIMGVDVLASCFVANTCNFLSFVLFGTA